jgi:V8-like Glu-specific endopeptidase
MYRPLRKMGVLGLSLAGVFILALTTTVAGPAQAATAGRAATTHAAAVSAADQQRVAQFWTRKRMRSAIPMDLLTVDRAQRLGRAAGGTPSAVGATTAAILSAGGPWTGGGAVTHTVGRVFFTFQSRAASCSGDAVTSANKSVVITAGHCVKLQGAWHTNWTFVPGYHNGNAPFGTWTAKQTMATPQWAASEDITYDVGAAVVNPLGGRQLVDVVGGQGIAFNQSRDRNMYAFGYPAASPYDGSRLIYCSGPTFDEFLGTGDLGMTCNMTGGASGGPWFLTFSEAVGTGTQNSVNSFKYSFSTRWMFGPYFGNDARNLYNAASAA